MASGADTKAVAKPNSSAANANAPASAKAKTVRQLVEQIVTMTGEAISEEKIKLLCSVLSDDPSLDELVTALAKLRCQ